MTCELLATACRGYRLTPVRLVGYGAGMTEADPSHGQAVELLDADHPDSVLIRRNPFAAIAVAAGSAPALALAALITATATLLVMGVTNDIADAKLYSSRGFDNLAELRWASGSRLVVAGFALLLAVIAGVRYSRRLPATRYTFSPDGEEATESSEGAEAPGWINTLVGSAVVVSVIAVVLNAIAFVMTLHLHESPNFGLPGG